MSADLLFAHAVYLTNKKWCHFDYQSELVTHYKNNNPIDDTQTDCY